MNKYNILCVGHDSALLRVRFTALASAGHHVGVGTPYWALLLLRNEHFDAVVMCHTLAEWERRLLAFQIESLGRNTPLVQLCSSAQGSAFQYVGRSGHSEALLSAVVSALGHKADASAA